MNGIYSALDAISPAMELLASVAVMATGLLLVTCLLSKAYRGASAAARYCIWQFGLTGSLLLPVLMLAIPGIPLGLSLVASSGTEPHEHDVPREAGRDVFVPAVGAPAVDSSEVGVPTQVVPSRVPAVPPRVVGKEQQPKETRQVTGRIERAEMSGAVHLENPEVARASIAGALAIVWMVGVAFHLLCLATFTTRMRWLTDQSEPIRGGRAWDTFRRLGPASKAELLSSAATKIPLAVGIWRPRIVLPQDFFRVD